MIQYIVNREKKEIEFLSGGSIEELKELTELFKDYTFKFSEKENTKTRITVGGKL